MTFFIIFNLQPQPHNKDTPKLSFLTKKYFIFSYLNYILISRLAIFFAPCSTKGVLFILIVV